MIESLYKCNNILKHHIKGLTLTEMQRYRAQCEVARATKSEKRTSRFKLRLSVWLSSTSTSTKHSSSLSLRHRGRLRPSPPRHILLAIFMVFSLFVLHCAHHVARPLLSLP